MQRAWRFCVFCTTITLALCPHANHFNHPQRCRGTTLAPSCPRSPTAGRAPPTPTSSTAPWSRTSATPATSWPARRSSCASGISHGVAMSQDVRKVKGSSLVFWGGKKKKKIIARKNAVLIEMLCESWEIVMGEGFFFVAVYPSHSSESTRIKREKQLYLNIKGSIWLEATNETST